MPSNPANTSVSYSGGVEATAVALIKAQLNSRFIANPNTGVGELDRTGLANWLRTDFASLTGDSASAYDATSDIAALAATLTPTALGYTARLLNGTEVTAAGVAAKKAEVEALGLAVDAYYDTFEKGTSTLLERMIGEYLFAIKVADRLPEIRDRVLESRFMVTTWITNWGEESSPSPPSDLLEVDRNDVPIITRPTPPANATELGIVGWRAYRSNSGSDSAGFQLVPDLYLITEKNPTGTVEEVIRATYAEVNPTGWHRLLPSEIAFWKGEAAAGIGTAGVPWTNQQLRANMLAAGADPAAVHVLPVVRATADALTRSDASLLTGDAFNCFKLTTTSYPDAAKSSQLQEILATTTWSPPPEKLRGLTGMANGIMAGFFGNTVCFSEAYVPYAWPVEYQITVDYPVVALAAFGTTLFVGTQGSVYLISGSDPSSMSSQVMPGGQSCSSARSVVATDGGVLFASPEGICAADLSGVKVMTAGMFTRFGDKSWSNMRPETTVAALHDGVYYLMFDRGMGTLGSTAAQVIATAYADIAYTPTSAESADWLSAATTNGWTLSQLRQTMLLETAAKAADAGYEASAISAANLLLESSEMGCYAMDLVSGKLTQVDVFGTAFYRNVTTDRLYTAAGTKIRDLFAGTTTRTSAYRTGVIQNPQQAPLAWLQVDGDFLVGAVVRWYGDGVLRYTKTLTDIKPVRLPPGRYLEHEVEVISTGKITSVTLASTTQELQNV